MKITSFSSLFYSLNLFGLAFGAYLVFVHSLYRIIPLYCLFNILFLWIIEGSRFTNRSMSVKLIKLADSEKIQTGLAVSFMMTLFVLVASSYERIYVRSPFTPPLIAVALILATLLGLASIGSHAKSFFTSGRFLLPAMISISLFVNFSIYLVQPNPFAQPLFATVDAYRDFANAARIVEMSGFRPQYMVLEGYYAEAPVVPILISILSLAGSLPIQVSQIILAATAEILGVVGVWLLSTAVIRRVDPALATFAGVLAVMFVWLQPYFIEPGFYFAPLRFSIPLLVLVVYLLYRTMASPRALSRSLLVSVLILVMIIAPMHATSAIAVVGFCLVAALLAPTHRHLGVTVVLIVLVLFTAYLLSGSLPYTTVLNYAQATFSLLASVSSRGGATSVSNAAASTGVVKVGELNSFMQALPLALLFSICTVCVAQSSRLLRTDLQSRRLNSLHLAFGIIAAAGLALGYMSSFFRIDIRYFAFPQIPLLIVACGVVLSLVLKNVNTSRTRGLLLIGIVVVYAFSMAASPAVLYEANETRPRLIPIESEIVAGNFVSANMIIGARPQILSDWPFYNYVMGVTYSANIGVEQTVNIANLMYGSPSNNSETFVILRQYYLQTPYLETISPYTGVLTNVTMWNSPTYNKIYDSSTTWVYLGTFGS